MADTQFSFSRVGVVGTFTADAQTSQMSVMVTYNYPSELGQSSQQSVMALTTSKPEAKTSQMAVMAVIKGRIDDSKVRAWTYTLDGHDYYVLRLGNIETLVFDTHTQEWSIFGSGTADQWRVSTGTNWQGSGSVQNGYGSDVVVGDDSYGTLYILNPDLDRDDGVILGSDNPQNFTRTVTGVLPLRGYNRVPCYGVQLYGDIGHAQVGAGYTQITLDSSDDGGVSYNSHGTLTVVPEEYEARIEWRSLGSMKAPGRLFRIRDTGGLKTITGAEVILDGDE